MKAFEVNVNGKLLDYRQGRNLDLEKIRKFFEKNFSVEKIWQEKRHAVAILKRDNKNYFLKLSTTEGISAVTKIEYKWNEEFNRLIPRTGDFWVPRNLESGTYENLFYLITDYFDGEKLADRPQNNASADKFKSDIQKIIEFSEMIEDLQIAELSKKDYEDYRAWFLEKTKSWYGGIPPEVRVKYQIEKLLNIVEKNHVFLKKRARHGDFTPWHMINLNGKIGLIDGEHAMKNSVEYYDISYIIQRTYSVLDNPDFAKKIFGMLIGRNYNIEKLRTVLAARAVGGFLDESLKDLPDYKIAADFKKWVTDLI